MNNPEIPKKQSEKRESREEKEIIEIKEFKLLCKEYHDRHAKGWDFNSLEDDKILFAKFEQVDVDLLKPEALKLVYWHRYAYLQALTRIGSNPKLKRFVMRFQRVLAFNDLRDITKSPHWDTIKESEEYKALQPSDFRKAEKALSDSIDILKLVNKSRSNWGDVAAEIITNDKIDDKEAAPRLQKLYEHLLANVKRVSTVKKKQSKA